MKKQNILIGVFVYLLLIPGLVFASADLKGMGNGAGPAATGDNAFEWNPAAMSPGNTFVWDFGILDTSLWSDSLSVMQILEYGGFVEGGNTKWSREDVNTILKSIPDRGFSLYLDHNTRNSMIIGPVGITLFNATAHARGTIDKDLFNFFLKGNTEYVDLTGGEAPAEKLFDLSNTQADLLATAESSVTVSLPVKHWLEKSEWLKKYFTPRVDEFYAGTTLRGFAGGYGNFSLTEGSAFYLSYSEPDEKGIQYPTIRFADDQDLKNKLAELEDGEMYPLVRGIYTLNTDDVMDLSYLGKGFAMDLGFYATRRNLTYGMSFMNMGSLRLNNYNIFEYGIVKDSTSEIDFTIADAPVIRQGQTKVKVPLPFRFNLGASYKHNRWLSAGAHLSAIRSVSVNIDDNNEIQTSARGNLELGAGIEANPLRVLPMRAGFVLGRRSFALTTGFGLHLGPCKTDVGVVTSYKNLSVSLNTSLEF